MIKVYSKHGKELEGHYGVAKEQLRMVWHFMTNATPVQHPKHDEPILALMENGEWALAYFGQDLQGLDRYFDLYEHGPLPWAVAYWTYLPDGTDPSWRLPEYPAENMPY